MSPLEKVPSVVKLDAPQLGEVALLIFRAKSVVDSGRREDGSCANSTSDEPVVFAGGETQDGRVESGHEAVGKREKRRCGVLSVLSGVG